MLLGRKLTLMFAVWAMLLAFVFSYVKGLVRMTQTIMGLTLAPLLGVFMLGTFSERANAHGT